MHGLWSGWCKIEADQRKAWAILRKKTIGPKVTRRMLWTIINGRGQILYKAHTDRKCMSDVFSAIGLSKFPWIKAHWLTVTRLWWCSCCFVGEERVNFEIIHVCGKLMSTIVTVLLFCWSQINMVLSQFHKKLQRKQNFQPEVKSHTVRVSFFSVSK